MKRKFLVFFGSILQSKVSEDSKDGPKIGNSGAGCESKGSDNKSPIYYPNGNDWAMRGDCANRMNMEVDGQQWIQLANGEAKGPHEVEFMPERNQ